MMEKIKSWASEKGALKRAEEAPRPRTYEQRQAELKAQGQKEREQAREEDKRNLEEAKRRFVAEKPKLEQRLGAIPAEIENYRRGLEEMKGPDMKKILDKEFELNSKQSPIDSTDPNRQREYEMWVRALDDSRKATQYLKADLGERIDKYQKKISELEKEKSDIERRIQRGY